MTKTQARTHLADAKRSIGKAQKVLEPIPPWILREAGLTAASEESTKSAVACYVREAEASLAALREFLGAVSA